MQNTIYFYPIILLLGLISSYTDIKYKKIKNNILVFCLLCAFFLYLYLFISRQISSHEKLFLNWIIALVISLLLYLVNIWGAGDAKLFFVYSFVLNSDKYTQLIPFPSILLFMNIFILSTIAILIFSILNLGKKKKLLLKRIFSIQILKKIIISFLIIFTIGWIIFLLLNTLNLKMAPLSSTIILYLFYHAIYKIINLIKKKDTLVIIFFLGLLFRVLIRPQDFTVIHILSYLKVVTLFTAIYYVLDIIFNLNKSEKNDNIVPFAPFMFLGALTINSDLILWVVKGLNFIRK